MDWQTEKRAEEPELIDQWMEELTTNVQNYEQEALGWQHARALRNWLSGYDGDSRIVGNCGGFIDVKKDGDVVVFIRYSAKQFFD